MRLPKPPKTAAITVAVPEGGKITLTEVMLEARANIKLADLGIDSLGVKRGKTGAFILEVPGKEAASKADRLAQEMKDLLSPRGVAISRPQKRAELRVKGLDETVTPEELATAVAKVGCCPVGEVIVGKIRYSPSGIGIVWVRCPLAAARKLAVAGRVLVGWVAARIQILPARPLQCYRCLEGGHIAQQCKADVDRSNYCYRCSGTGHQARECTESPSCALCVERQLPSGHRLGGPSCKALTATKVGGRGSRKVKKPPEEGGTQPAKPQDSEVPQTGQGEKMVVS